MSVTVVHVITKLELGGAQRNTLYTVSHLDPVRFKKVLIVGEPGLLDEEARRLTGVTFLQIPSLVRPIRPLSDVLAFLSLFILFVRLKPTIVHTHSSKAGILGRFAAWIARVPIIIHSIHGFGFTPKQSLPLRRGLFVLEWLASRCTTMVISVSETNRRQGIRWGLFAPDRSVVIRSGIHLETFRKNRLEPSLKPKLVGVDAGVPLVGMVAPMKPQKAPLDFVRMAAEVHRLVPSAHFLMVGDGQLRPAVEQEIASLGLGRVFHLLGWRNDLVDIYKCLTVFALTSLWEGLPRVYLEALSSGIPVVGTRVDGAAEVIQDGFNGYLVDPGDMVRMADRVRYLIANPSIREAMGQAGRRLPRSFDIDEMVRQQESEYERLLGTQEGRIFLSESVTYDTSTKES